MAVEQGSSNNFPPVLPLEQLIERTTGESRQNLIRELELKIQMSAEEREEYERKRLETTLSNLERLITSGSAENFFANEPTVDKSTGSPQITSDSNS